ncbi:MAG: hypothetical protein H7833_08735 [Magnetococcus sp. DMHC-1]|nr:hypothetical protein [Magnetococcales bacterium]
MSNLQFSEFLKKKRERDTLSGHIDWEIRRKIWLDKLDFLFHRQIAAWLSPYQKEGFLDTRIDQVAIQEDVMGTWGRYDAPMMAIHVISETVTLTPVGMVILGGLGRVDMVGSLGKLMLVLNDSGQAPGFHMVRVTSIPPKEAVFHNLESARSQQIIPMEERMRRADWYFVPPTDRRSLLRVTEETFTEHLQNIVRS